MTPLSRRFLPSTVSCIVISLALACSHQAVAPETTSPASTAQLPEVPAYADVPHPSGTDLSDVRALFRVKGAPELKDLKDCDSVYQKLKTATASLAELQEGVRELVRGDPAYYHWCFYGKVLSLEEVLSGDTYIDERQKATIDTYSFIAPVGRAFMTEFYDSRYLRWAMRRYEAISERVFYRRLQTTPNSTSAIVEATNPFGLWKDTTRGPAAPDNVLEKYGIAATQTLKASPTASAVVPVPAAAAAPAVASNPPAAVTPPTAPVSPSIPAVDAVPNIVTAPVTVGPAVATDALLNAAPATTTAPVTVKAPVTDAASLTAISPSSQSMTSPKSTEPTSVDKKSEPSDSVSMAESRAAAAGAASQSAIYGSAASVGSPVQTAVPETAPVKRQPAEEVPFAAAATPAGTFTKPVPDSTSAP